MPPEKGEKCPPPQRRFEKPRRPADWPLASAPAVTAGVSANRPVPRGGAPPLARNPAKHPAARATPAVATLGTWAPTPRAHPCGKRPSSDVSSGPSAGGKKLDGERSGGRAGAGAGTHRKPGLSPTRLGPGGPLGGVRPGDVGADGHKACGGRVCVWSRKQGRACVTHRLFGLPRLTGAKGQERPGSVPRGAPVGRDGGQRSTQTQPHSDSNSASTGQSHGQ